MRPPLSEVGSVEEQAEVACGGGPRAVGYAPEPEPPRAITLRAKIRRLIRTHAPTNLCPWRTPPGFPGASL